MLNTREEECFDEDNDREWTKEDGKASAVSSCSRSKPSVEYDRVQRRPWRSPHEDDTDCFQDLLRTCSNIFHVCDLLMGLILLGYTIAIFIHDQPSDHWHTFPIILTIWAALLLTAGSTGLYAVYSPICRRYGLKVSAITGITIAVWDSALLLFFLARKHSFLHYLTLRKEKFYLTDSEIDAFDRKSSVGVFIVLVFVFVEALRFYMLRQLREDLLEQDDFKLDVIRRKHVRQRRLRVEKWKTAARSGDESINDCNKLQPLLACDNSDGDGDLDYGFGNEESDVLGYKEDKGVIEDENEVGSSNGHHNTLWWEDPPSDTKNQEISHSKEKKKRWNSFLNPWRKSKQDKTSKIKDQIYRDVNISNDSNDEDFAPIDEELSLGSMEWERSPKTHQPNFASSKELLDERNEPDLSWAVDQD